MGAHKGRQNRCRSQAGRHTRPSRIKKDTAVHANTTREQGLAFRDTRGSQLPLLPPSRLPTHLKLVSSTSWAPQADEPTHGQAQEGPPGQPQEGIGNRGATSKGGRERERGWQSLTRVCRTHHKLLRSFGVMRHAQPASALADPGATHLDLGRRPDDHTFDRTSVPIFVVKYHNSKSISSIV